MSTTITYKAKGRYAREDLRCWVAHYGVPFQRHTAMVEIDFRQLLRVTLLARDRGAVEQVAGALYHAVWGSEALRVTSRPS